MDLSVPIISNVVYLGLFTEFTGFTLKHFTCIYIVDLVIYIYMYSRDQMQSIQNENVFSITLHAETNVHVEMNEFICRNETLRQYALTHIIECVYMWRQTSLHIHCTHLVETNAF